MARDPQETDERNPMDEPPLSVREAAAMGNQAVREIRGVPESTQVIYGETDGGYDNEDQVDAHHAEPDEHL